MFSPGKWNEQVPREVGANLKYRAAVLGAAAYDKAMRADLVHVCKNDCLFYINTFVFQHNPNALPGHEIGPFATWPFQDEAVLRILDHIHRQQDLVVEKSREMGATWLFLIVMDWLAKFHANKSFLCVSRSADAVDHESMNSLFAKLDFMTEYQPTWLYPKRKRRSMYIGFDNGSSITGEASTGRAGVGGRATAMFVDEFSQIKEDQELLDRTADTTKCRIFNFTHTGLSTAAYELSQRKDLRKLVMHWSQHPQKNQGLYHFDPDKRKIIPHDYSYPYPPDYPFTLDSRPTGGPFPGLRSPWYDAECVRRDNARAVAMDLDINPQGATSQFFNALSIHNIIRDYATDPLWVGDLDYDKATGRPKELVPNASGRVKMWARPMMRGRPAPGKYGLGADIAAGTGASPSVASIINADTSEKVLEFSAADMEPQDFGVFCVALGWLFKDHDDNGALLAWEDAGGLGKLYKKRVLALGYGRLYMYQTEGAMVGKAPSTPGWKSTEVSKRVLLDEYRQAIQSRRLTNRSKAALEECLGFAYVGNNMVTQTRRAANNDPSGAGVNHGDIVIADALAWRAATQLSGGQFQPQEVREQVQIGSLDWRRRLWKDHDAQKEAWY